MSSKGFEVVLDPAIPLRRGLLAFSACATFIGIALIGSMPLRPALKTLFAFLWLLRGVLEMVSLVRGMSRTKRLRISAPGTIEALSPEGETRPVELLAGSLVLSRAGWLRLRFEDGLRYGELLTPFGRHDDGWRTLMLIWRHQVFGGPRGS